MANDIWQIDPPFEWYREYRVHVEKVLTKWDVLNFLSDFDFSPQLVKRKGARVIVLCCWKFVEELDHGSLENFRVVICRLNFSV